MNTAGGKMLPVFFIDNDPFKLRNVTRQRMIRDTAVAQRSLLETHNVAGLVVKVVHLRQQVFYAYLA